MIRRFGFYLKWLEEKKKQGKKNQAISEREENKREKTGTIDFQACMAGAELQPLELDRFLSRLKTHQFAISCMAFQDVWNVDLERIQDCCIHIFSPDGRMIPFCMYNLTDARGQSLYRSIDTSV